MGSGAQVLVTGAPLLLSQLDAALWAISPVDFVPHCNPEDDARVIASSPVMLSHSIQSSPHRQVLLNLDYLVPEGFEYFARVIEIIGSDDVVRQLSRSRWKLYTDRGYSITRHDLATANSQS